ncbi:polysaccharide biosynthesis tyrosine autokinase [Legionella impletisoli]|uniref:Tyrosine-protein kinase involved in EPS biosynthesis n=1 Tax=Legionella impletisoli TaxID=343510 RepID=A0A917JSY1_9GAMM|nr:polysaccharide biosynthesis tyrosine autokinase [Legionella impletisoli]GGI82237.1 tyrosine-protein kinase involved in EPS biosynthesis [Legionella impletisoli]
MSTNAKGTVYNHDEDEIDLSAIFSQLWANKWLIVAVVLLCLLIGGLYSARQVPQYKSDVLIQVDEKNNSSFMGGDALSSFGFSNQNNASAIISALIKSRFILTPVIQSLGLNISISPERSFWQKLVSKGEAKAEITLFNVPKDQLSEPFKLVYEGNNTIALFNAQKKPILQGKIGEVITSRTQPIRLKVKSLEAPRGTYFILKKFSSSKIVSQLTEQLKIEGLGENKKDTGLLAVSLKGSNPAVLTKILNEIAHTAKLKNAEKKSLEASQTLNFLRHQLPLAKESLASAEFELNQYRAKSGKIDIKMQASLLLDQLAELDKQLATLRINEIEMGQKYTDAHPSLVGLKRQVNEIEHEKQQLEQKIKKLPESDQIALGLMREVEVKSALYTSLLNRIQELEVVKAGMVSDVQILSLAKLPDEPLPSKTKLIYLASLFLGLMISVAIILGRKIIFPKVQDPHWTERHFNIANLAIIPFSKEQQELIKNLKTMPKGQSKLLAEINPKNLSIESLRSLRTSLQISLTCANNNIMTILGISPGVGKTFVSTNLAHLLATTGKRVLFIDADLRRGTAHKYFNLDLSPGFSELIQNKTTRDEALRATGHKNLTILSCGQYPDDPAELLTSNECKTLIDTFSKEYDIVLVDTPPVLLVTDAVLISSKASLNYLVIGANMHRQEDIEMTIKRLQAAGVPITGTIFNCQSAVAQTNINQYYSYSYYYDDNSTPNTGVVCKIKKFAKSA